MLRKLVIGGVLAGAVAFLAVGAGAFSYVRTFAERTRAHVQNNVPVEFQIDRARAMLDDLKPEIHRHIHAIASEEVELERLAEQVDGLRAKQASQKQQLQTMQAELSSGRTTFVVNGRERGAGYVEDALRERFAGYKTSKTTLDKLEKVYDIRSQKLSASRNKLDEMLAMRKQLELELERVDAQRELIEVAKASSRLSFDNSRLGKIKELVSDIEVKLTTEERYMATAEEIDFDQMSFGETVIEDESDSDILDEVTQYFAEENGDVEVDFASIH